MYNQNSIGTKHNSLLKLHELGQTNCCTVVKYILNEVNFEHAWVEQSMNNYNYSLLKDTLQNSFMEICMESISISNPKLRKFKLFKNEHKLETYLMSTKSLNLTLSLFHFRISSHNLRIETGRYARPKTPEIEWKCLYCSAQDIENELHFLTQCPLYLIERNELFDVIKYIPNVF